MNNKSSRPLRRGKRVAKNKQLQKIRETHAKDISQTKEKLNEHWKALSGPNGEYVRSNGEYDETRVFGIAPLETPQSWEHTSRNHIEFVAVPTSEGEWGWRVFNNADNSVFQLPAHYKDINSWNFPNIIIP